MHDMAIAALRGCSSASRVAAKYTASLGLLAQMPAKFAAVRAGSWPLLPPAARWEVAIVPYRSVFRTDRYWQPEQRDS